MQFRGPWIYFFLSTLLSSVGLYLYRPPITHLNLMNLALSVCVSATCWWLTWLLYCTLSRQRARLAFSCVVGCFVSLLAVSTTLLYLEFGSFISRDMIEFVQEDPVYLLNYMQTYLPGPVGVALVLLGITVSFLWYRAPGIVLQPSLRLFGVGLVALVCLNGSLNHLRSADGRHHQPLDSAFLVGLRHSFKTQNHQRLHTSFQRAEVNPPSAPSDLNIVLIINESWSKLPLELYGRTRANGPMKFLNRWFNREADSFFLFHNAFTSSNATELSVPSILTGVGAYQSNQALHTMPLLWDWAAAAGHQSLFTSSQRLTWKQLREFLLVPGPSAYAAASEMDTPIVNDLGVDDLVAVKHFRSLLRKIPRGTSWVAVHNTNALHPPFQQTSTQLDPQPNYANRYDNALSIVDTTIAEIYKAVEARGELSNTLFILTSDHCMGPMKKALPRIASFYDESVNIPFLIRVPKTWLTAHPKKAQHLKANQDRVVSNIDIVPTVLDLLNLEESNQATTSKLHGESLLEPISAERYAISINANDTRRSIHEGFGISRETQRFVFSTVEGAGLYDVQSDPAQTRNLWDESSIEKKQRWLSLIRERPNLSRIYSSNSSPSRLE